MWDTNVFNLRDVRPNETYNFAFKYTGIDPIVFAESGCSCTNVRIVKEGDATIVSGVYHTPKEFPPVLKEFGRTDTIVTQSITVGTQSQNTFYLTIQGRMLNV